MPDPVSVAAVRCRVMKKSSSPLSGYVTTGVVGGVESDHLVMSVNTPVPHPMVIYQVTVCAYHELLCAIALT